MIEDAFGIDRSDAPGPSEFVEKVHAFSSVRQPDRLLGELMVSIAQSFGAVTYGADTRLHLDFLFDHLDLARQYEESPQQFRGIDKVLGRDMLSLLGSLTTKQAEALRAFIEAGKRHLSLNRDVNGNLLARIDGFHDWFRGSR